MIKLLKLLTWDFSTLLLFELIYKLTASLVAFPLLQELMKYSIKKAGFSFLANHNFYLIFKNPVAVLLLIVLVLLFAFYIYIEMTAIIIYCEKAMKGERTGVFSLFAEAIRRALHILNPRNLILLLFVLVIIPISGVNLTSGPLSVIRIPNFFLDFINQIWMLRLIWFLILLFVGLLVFRWVFSIHEVTLKGSSFRQACRISRAMLKKRYLKTFFIIIGWTVAVAFVVMLLFFVGSLLIMLHIKLFYKGLDAEGLFWFRFDAWVAIGNILFTIFGVACNIGMITLLYYHYQPDLLLTIPNKAINKHKKNWIRKITKIIVIVLLLFIYTSMSTVGGFLDNKSNIYYETEIVAHRAASMAAPENTLPALAEAVNSEAEFAEIDIQQTKDGVLILMHDQNFVRTTGVLKNVWDVSYEEVKSFDAGSWFSEEFAGEKIPTLEEVLAFAVGNIKLMIELKSTGHEKDLVGSVIDLIEQYEMEEQCVIASMNLNLLQESKKINPKLLTVYITTLAYGDFYGLEEVDMYSVEASFVTRRAIKTVHAQGKKIYAWTVNDEEIMRNLQLQQVDGIITDNPYLAQFALHTRLSYPLIEYILNIVF